MPFNKKFRLLITFLIILCLSVSFVLSEYDSKYDVTDDGVIDERDITVVAGCKDLGISGTFEDIDCGIADVNDDGVVDQVDWQLVLDFYKKDYKGLIIEKFGVTNDELEDLPTPCGVINKNSHLYQACRASRFCQEEDFKSGFQAQWASDGGGEVYCIKGTDVSIYDGVSNADLEKKPGPGDCGGDEAEHNLCRAKRYCESLGLGYKTGFQTEWDPSGRGRINCLKGNDVQAFGVNEDELKKLHCSGTKYQNLNCWADTYCRGEEGFKTGIKNEWKQVFCLGESSRIWKSMNGPPGGGIRRLTLNLDNPNELFAISSRGIHKSENKGENWHIMGGSENLDMRSIATYGDRLFFCGENVGYFDEDDDMVTIIGDYWCDDMSISNNKLFIAKASWDIEAEDKLKYADLKSSDFNWNDISPTGAELSDLEIPPNELYRSLKIRAIISLGDKIFANIFFDVEGSGEYSNGYLYKSEDNGRTWQKVELDVPEKSIVANIVQDPADPEHIFALYRHPIIHEFKYSTKNLIWESQDGGDTWSRMTSITELSNGVTDVDVLGSVYYFLEPYDGRILKYTNSHYEYLEMPYVEGYSDMGFTLEWLIFDPDDSQIVYGQTGDIWELGLVKSTDNMNTWKKMDNDIIASSPTIVLADPVDNDIIYTSGNVIQESYRTTDFGKNWEPFTPYAAGDELKLDPYNPGHILIVDEMTQLYESYNSGKDFQRIAERFSSAKVFDFEIANNNPNKIYVSNNGLGISKGEDNEWGDHSWTHMTGSSDYAYDIEIDPEDSDVLYASYSPKIFEDFSKIMKYDPDYEENFGWMDLHIFEDSAGITSLKFDPQDPNKMYAGLIGEEGTIYVSNDKGKTWDKLNDDLTFTTIWGHSQLQIAPDNKNTVYAGTWGGGSYKTIDGGKSWIMMDEKHTFSPVCLAISNKNPDIVYACDRTAPKIHKSTDAGKTWTEYYDFGEDYMLTSAVVIDPDDPNTIYAAAFLPPMAHTGGLVKIENGAATEIGKDLPRSVLEIEIDPENKNIIYVTTHIHGVYKSEDSGNTWKQIDDKGNGLPRIGFYDIDVDPIDSNILYATALCGELPDYMMPPKMIQLLSGFKNLDPNGKCGVYKSTDQGENWNLILETISEARGIDIDPENNNNLYVADMMGGVWVSNDAGSNWRQENTGLGSISMTSVKIKDDYVYASTQGSGVYAGKINQDKSITWDSSRSNKPKAKISNMQIKVDPSNSNRIFASADAGGLLRSDDGGKHWNDKNFLTPSIKVDDPFLQGYYAFDINPQDTENIWLGVYGKGMFVSYDGMEYEMFANGDDKIMEGKHIKSVKINPADPDEVYVGSEEGVFVTYDGGENWEEMNEGLETLDIRSLKITDSGNVYVGTGGYGIYLYDSNNHRWRHLGRTLSTGFWTAWDRRIYQFSSILFDLDIEGKVYLGSFPGGFFISEDNGYSWKDSSLGLGNDGIFSLTMHPANHDIIWAGTYNGVSKSSDRGETWEMKGKKGIEELKEEAAWEAWADHRKGIIPPEQWPYTIAIDDENPDIMYISTKNGRNKGFCHRNENAKGGHDRNNLCGIVMKSTDGGETWFEIMDGLDWGSEFYNLLIYPKDHNVLFLSTNQGVYLSRNKGNNWEPITGDLPSTSNQVRDNVADNLALTADNRYLILGLKNYGIWKADISKLGLISKVTQTYTYNPQTGILTINYPQSEHKIEIVYNNPAPTDEIKVISTTSTIKSYEWNDEKTMLTLIVEGESSVPGELNIKTPQEPLTVKIDNGQISKEEIKEEESSLEKPTLSETDVIEEKTKTALYSLFFVVIVLTGVIILFLYFKKK